MHPGTQSVGMHVQQLGSASFAAYLATGALQSTENMSSYSFVESFKTPGAG